MKNALRVSLSVLVSVLALGASAPLAFAATINVPANYATIQAAVDAAINGDTITVDAGTYNVTQIYINGKSLTLTGAGSATTIIDGGKNALSSAGMIKIRNVTAGPVVIQGFTLQNAGLGGGTITAIAISHSTSQMTIQNNHFIGYSGGNVFDQGVWTYGSTSNGTSPIVISNNEFEQMWQGVLLELPRGGATLEDNNFHNLVASDDGSGTLFEAEGIFAFTYPNGDPGDDNISSLVKINHNNFHDYSGEDIAVSGGYISHGGSDYGTRKFTNVAITNNTVNAVGSGSERRHVGIYLINTGLTSGDATLGGVDGATITGNTITTGDANSFGIHLTGPNNNATIQNNTISGLGKGIATDESALGAGFSTGLSFSGNTSPTSVFVNGNYADGLSNDNHVFGYDATTTIQSGISAVASGGTINVAVGTYAENILVNKSVTLQGAGQSLAGTIISPVGGTGVEITASTVSLTDFRINPQGSGTGIHVTANIDNLTIDSVTETNADWGFLVGDGVIVNGLTVMDSHFDSNASQGWYLSEETALGGNVTNVNVTNTTFNDNINKGIYAEKLDHAVFDGITVNNSGTGGPLNHRAGIDINLKWAAYSNIQILNSYITNSGTGDPNGAGILIKARSTGGYSSPAATLDTVTLSNLTVTGNGGGGAYAAGIRVGEANNSLTGIDAGPTNVSITNSNISGNALHELRNATAGTTVTATNNWWGSAVETDILSKISGDVSYNPWYTNASMTTLTDGSTTTATDATYTSPTDGQADLPTGATDVVLTDTTVLDVNSSKNDVVGGNVVVSGVSQDLTSYDGGNLSNQNLDTAQDVGGTSVTIGTAVNLQSGTNNEPIVLSNSDLTNVSVSIPDNTTILAPSGWNGTVAPPTTGDSSGTAPSGFTVGTTMDVGSPDVVLLFDRPVTIFLSGITGTVGYRAAGSSSWNTIAACGGTYDDPTSPTFPGECSIVNPDGSGTKILTFHFTEFGEFIPDPTPTTPPTHRSSRAAPATPATPAVPGVSSATPATPSTNSNGNANGRVLGAATFNFLFDFGVGSRHADVTELQKILLGGSHLKVAGPTGYFGALTLTAVKSYQKAHGINQTGFVGPLTRAELNKEASVSNQTASVGSSLTAEQVSSIIALIESFGADAATMDKIRAAFGI